MSIERDPYYYELPNKSTIADQITALATNPEGWAPYYGWMAKKVSNELVDQDPFFKWLRTKHDFQQGLLKMSPGICYDWHMDERRGCGINMIALAEGESHCYFSYTKGLTLCFFEELKYKPGTYYLFNTRAPHTIFNHDKERVMFSVEFFEPKEELNFQDVLKVVKEFKLMYNTLLERKK